VTIGGFGVPDVLRRGGKRTSCSVKLTQTIEEFPNAREQKKPNIPLPGAGKERLAFTMPRGRERAFHARVENFGDRRLFDGEKFDI